MAGKSEDILNFDKKKKKKKPTATSAETKPESETKTLNEPLVFPAVEKKKKAKEVDESEPNEEASEPILQGKKKKKTTVDVDKLADDFNAELNFGSKKKKKVNIGEVVMTGDEKPCTIVTDGENQIPTGDYTYEKLLKRVFAKIFDENPELMSEQKRRIVMYPPQLARVGTKKTSFVNFTAIAEQLNRDASHLSSYMLIELGTEGSTDANGALIIRGRYQSKHIEPVLINYCRNYVLCATCQSPDTRLSKDSRLLFLTCNRCNSRISVKTVQGGFHALTAKRAAMRAKAQ